MSGPLTSEERAALNAMLEMGVRGPLRLGEEGRWVARTKAGNLFLTRLENDGKIATPSAKGVASSSATS